MKYFLDKIPLSNGEEEIKELDLVENGKNETTSFYQKYHQKVNVKEREKRKVVEEKIVPHTRILGNDGSLYFKEVDKFNLNEIVDGFDEQEYINGLKKASQ